MLAAEDDDACDFVAYEVHVLERRDHHGTLDDDDDDDDAANNLEATRRDLLEVVRPELDAHVFTVDPFELTAGSRSRGQDGTPMSCFRGRTRVCDGMEDTWFIAHVLREMTRRRTGVCLASMLDQDGDPLLIEAADALPAWLEPDTSAGRVYFFEGHLHIVPPAVVALGAPASACRAAIVAAPLRTRASPQIEDLLAQGPFGAAFREQWASHKFAVAIPDAVARVATQRPGVLSSAVHALRHVIPSDRLTKNARRLEHFGPQGRMRLQQIRLSRTSYAQLQHFASSAGGLNLPHLSSCDWDVTTTLGVSPARLERGLRLGTALAIGLELVLAAPVDAPFHDADSQASLLNIPDDEISAKALPQTPPPEDDSDRWIEVEPGALESVLEQVSGSVASVFGGADASGLESLSADMRSFFASESGFEGIDDDDDDDDDDEEEDQGEVSTKDAQRGAAGMAESASAGNVEPISQVRLEVDRLLEVLHGNEPRRVNENDVGENDDGDNDDDDDDDDRLLDEAADELLDAELSAEPNLVSTFGGSDGDGLAPFDVDLNLVQNLVDSVIGEGTDIGPASSLVSRLTEDLRSARLSK